MALAAAAEWMDVGGISQPSGEWHHGKIHFRKEKVREEGGWHWVSFFIIFAISKYLRHFFFVDSAVFVNSFLPAVEIVGNVKAKMLLDLIMVGPVSIRRRPEAEVRGPIHCQLKLPEEKAQ
jgi:hypothetical protein